MIRNSLPFATLPEWLLLSEVSDRAVRLYAVLVRHADRAGRAHPSRRRLAQILRCSLSSVDRALEELVRLGALEVVQRTRDADGSQTSNDYVLRPEAGATATPPSSPVTTPLVTGEYPPLVTGEYPMNESHIEREPEYSETSSLRTLARERDELWETLFALEAGTPYSPEARQRLTRKAAAALNAAAAEIRETGVSAEELRAAIRAWPRVMGEATCTAHGVAKHLPRLLAAANGLVARRSELDEVAEEAERLFARRTEVAR